MYKVLTFIFLLSFSSYGHANHHNEANDVQISMNSFEGARDEKPLSMNKPVRNVKSRGERKYRKKLHVKTGGAIDKIISDNRIRAIARKKPRQPDLRRTSGLSVRALFAGASGTGKTMAAELLANKLNLDLYRIDLSQVVSKYIGETEKNLEKVFNKAEQKNWVLFFDDADALFGKRTDVKDSHDRNTNQATSYLLQRMEAYDGIAILATNLNHNFDTEIMNRFQYVVEFQPAKIESNGSEWKYVAVRRMARSIEESIYKGIQWVIYEPNNEPLWRKVKRFINNMLYEEWRNGKLKGSKNQEAFFVRCDRSTMSRDDLDKGYLVCNVGVALVKPTEFIMLKIKHKTASTE